MGSRSLSKPVEKEISFHMNIIARHVYDTRRGKIILATYKQSRYPSFYVRDAMAVARFLRTLIEQGLFVEKAYEILRGIAKFTRSVQSKEGRWGQKYNEYGRERSLYKQEDNTAHGIILLGDYLIARKHLGRRLQKKKYVEAMLKGFEFARNNVYDESTGLFRSTTSCHESSIETGYTLWTNMAYYKALKNLIRVGELYRAKTACKPVQDFMNSFSENLKQFIRNKRYVARIHFNGKIDFRADVTLVSPYYFEYDKKSRALENAVRYAEKKLRDPDLGLYQRYLPNVRDLAKHSHAGSGPWMQYSAIIAQYHLFNGRMIKANRILGEIDRYKSSKGYIPEHITTTQRFLDFMKNEWKTGLDFQKEFDPSIMVDNYDFDCVVEELINMRNAYQKTKRNLRKESKRGFINFALPLSWSHAEYAYAILLREELRRKRAPGALGKRVK
ncbi:hypothetical protein D6764_00050 [Candidatus Woesearchaeota archaeon]|nr:MAG: hypothetical protein D6764_00050 [Candidatus Woesearchaeota archaeon]